MSEAAYRRLTFDLTLSAARALATARPNATLCYVSGEGTDSSERGRTMWARVKGATENALLQLPLDVYLFRPGFIRARPGVRSKTRLYRLVYAIVAPLYPVLKRIAPTHVTTAENIARAMIAVSIARYPKGVLENPDINAAAGDTNEPILPDRVTIGHLSPSPVRKMLRVRPQRRTACQVRRAASTEQGAATS